MRMRLLPLLLACCLMAGCASEEAATSYRQINAETAKNMMDEQPEAVVLDVRQEDEFEDGHIPGAVLLPLDTISGETASEAIPTTDTVVMIYCRSGNRSKKAAQALADLGYTNLYEFGGINDWPYDVTE